ncbi:LysE family translocator [Shewanella psychropiezotolerans]|uniref:LysE family translocator n=1 Tax=Shewanella psychropiezotolerans TaxID=2593655 RepID=A0ABX5WY69_9GAMM|nr:MULTISPECIES: LysE family translocator [Shewanella]MPY26605.1 LysE family translocator [Shewanella sp. YLB-07]QDO83733.1 LysE family translocator [Shewanella psychropiezotolerans]
MELQLLISLAIIHSVALASPGPDFALVVKMASQESRATAIASAVGISVAILLHSLLSVTGVSLLIKSSDLLFVAVQLIGASYLGWMGIGAIRGTLSQWRDKASSQDLDNASHLGLSIKQGFFQGLYTNLLNPKAMVFFITLFSAMITPDINVITKVSAVFIMLILSLIWFIFIALVLSKPLIQLKVKRASPIINLVTGILFISVAIIIVSGAV